MFVWLDKRYQRRLNNGGYGGFGLELIGLIEQRYGRAEVVGRQLDNWFAKEPADGIGGADADASAGIRAGASQNGDRIDILVGSADLLQKLFD